MDTERPVTSLLDTDFYALTMSQAAYHLYPDTYVRSAFTNRTTSVRLAEFVPEAELRKNLDALLELRFRTDELDYLESHEINGVRVFKDDFLQFLKGVRLPPYTLVVRDGQFDVQPFGRWPRQIFAETPFLSTISELYGRAYEKRYGETDWWAEGQRRLDAKIPRINAYPDLRIMEFGTRRRRSRAWQWNVGRQLRDRLQPGILLGTSNVLMAKELSLKPLGTMAHQWFMIITALCSYSDEALRTGHNLAMQKWFQEYGQMLSILLTDTFTTPYCFRDMTREQAQQWDGLRQDSLEPVQYGRLAADFYQRHGIDSKTKKLVFSDGLDVETMINLLTHFKELFRVLFGWGTNATNDTGMPPLSLVLKPIVADLFTTVKLPDNLAKAMGPEMQRYMDVLDCLVTERRELHS